MDSWLWREEKNEPEINHLFCFSFSFFSMVGLAFVCFAFFFSQKRVSFLVCFGFIYINVELQSVLENRKKAQIERRKKERRKEKIIDHLQSDGYIRGWRQFGSCLLRWSQPSFQHLPIPGGFVRRRKEERGEIRRKKEGEVKKITLKES